MNGLVLDDRFWSKVRKKPKGCWEWAGTERGKGYGVFWLGKRLVYVHRLSYVVAHQMNLTGLNGLEIHHTCGNKVCVNPSHLEAMTPETHKKELDSCASMQRAKTHCPQGHRYSEDNLVGRLDRSNGHGRECKECGRLRANAWYVKKRAKQLEAI